MTWVHAVRGLYLLVSVVVAVVAGWRSRHAPRNDARALAAFAAYGLSTAAGQAYAFDKPLTVGTAYVGVGVGAGAAWLVAIATHR